MNLSTLLEILTHGSVFSLLLLVIIVTAVGSRVVTDHKRLRLWGCRVGGIAGVVHAITAILMLRPADAETLVAIAIRSVLSGTLAMGLAWVLLPVSLVLHQSFIEAPLSSIRRRAEWRRFRASLERPSVALQEYQERLRLDAERRAVEQRQQQNAADARRRRADARASLLLEYSLLESRLRDRFSRAAFDKYVQDFLGDEPPEDVERRARELLSTLKRHLEEQKPAEAAFTLEQLDTWFQAERERIDRSSADDRLKRRLIAALNVRYAELTTKMMEDLKP